MTTSFPGAGLLGIFMESNRESTAIPDPIRNTADGVMSQSMPIKTGRTTAAMWLMVKLTLAVAAISAGSAIF